MLDISQKTTIFAHETSQSGLAQQESSLQSAY